MVFANLSYIVFAFDYTEDCYAKGAKVAQPELFPAPMSHEMWPYSAFQVPRDA